ncbi:lymphocyte-specific protein 1 isoform X1 [Bufo bufo]|uniref:lymphocyte-specific protein 1 isoform X1 n=1 Tax=Bufo bufo TaxID=8384 RepID=UPI001ABEC5CA|nr:lymphocyte-specific protein 1 isoform X1 [Bufo bufo]
MSDSEDAQRQDAGEQQATIEEQLEETQRLTSQWSVEDEEEAARERRRRERQQQGGEGQSPEDGNEETCSPSEEHMGLKPAGTWETEEDEGFSDWSQKLEQMKLKGAAQATEEREEFKQMEGKPNGDVGTTEEEAGGTQPNVEEEEDEGTSRYEAVEVNDKGDPCNYEHSSYEANTSETMTVTSNQWETRESNDNEEENRAQSPHPREEAQNLEQVMEIKVYQFEPYNEQRESDGDRWRPEEVKRQSVSSDGEDNDGTITVKITERAEVLNRTIEKSNSIKRSEPPLPINKIDDRLEQYTHAIESSSKTGRLVRQPSLELLSPADAVSSKKNMWESGDVTTASKLSPCKDTEGINIAVSDMINQWGKGKSEPDDHVPSPKVTEVKPGDVLSKKSLWEQNSKSVQSNKNMMPKYKFVPTGHGKYEKVRLDEP